MNSSLLDPKLYVEYIGISDSYDVLSPRTLQVDLQIFLTDVKFTTNIESGTWSLINSKEMEDELTVERVTSHSRGIYNFSSDKTWNGENKEVFRVEIVPTGK